MAGISKELLHNCGVIPMLGEYSKELADVACENGLKVTAVDGEFYCDGMPVGKIPEEPDILIGTFEGATLDVAMKNRDVCAVVDAGFMGLDVEEFSKRCRQARKAALGYGFAHLGINHENADMAIRTAAFLKEAFGFPSFDIGGSIIAGGPFELVKTRFRGKNGHVGIETASVERAIFDLTAKGFVIDEDSIQRSPDQRIQSVYLVEEVSGFEWHLLQKR